MSLSRPLIRGARLTAHILIALPLAILFFHRPRHGSRIQRSLFQWWLRGVCRILRVRIVVRGTPADGSLLAANHISWLDIPALASVWYGTFLSKAEVAKWPVIGWLVRRSGTLLIRRGSVDSLHRATDAIRHRLERGDGICIFPEGTTTNGRSVRRFRPRLFESAIRAGAPVQPVALRYLGPDGRRHPHAPFIGEDAFLPHLLRLLRGPAITVEVTCLPPLRPDGHTAAGLAVQAHRRVTGVIGERGREGGHAAKPDRRRMAA